MFGKDSPIENIERRVGYNYSIEVQVGSSKDRVKIESQGSADTHKDVMKEMKQSVDDMVETATEQRKKLQENL